MGVRYERGRCRGSTWSGLLSSLLFGSYIHTPTLSLSLSLSLFLSFSFFLLLRLRSLDVPECSAAEYSPADTTKL
jgi:hypothetical protein